MMPITTPTFGRLHDYAGVWAMEPRAAAMMHDRIRNIDLTAHVAKTNASPPKVTSQLSTVSASNGQRVAVITMTGPLMKALSSMDESGSSTVQLRRDIRKAANDPDVSAIVLAIDSPGGTVAGTADLGAEVKAATGRKPVIAFIDDLGASAAYWVASQADAIYANNATANIGSIGALAVVYDVSAHTEANGIKTFVFGTGPLKGAGTPGSPVTEDQQEYFRGIVSSAQESFDAAVQSGRGFTGEQLNAVKSGGVFSAAEALNLKLIDGIMSFEMAVEKAVQARSGKNQTRAASPATQGAKMTDELNGTGPVAVADPILEMRAKFAAEATRIDAINTKTVGYPAIAAKAIAEGWTPEKAELESLKASLPSGVGVGPAIITRSNTSDITADSLAAGVLTRCGIQLDSPLFAKFEARSAGLPAWMTTSVNSDARDRVMNQGHKLRNLSMIDICREAVIRDGNIPSMDRSELIQAAVSGGTLTGIFTTSVNAAMVLSYLQAGDTTEAWTMTEDVADFKTNERIRLETIGGTMKKLPRGGEADHAERADRVESYRVARYSEQFVIDEQDIIDDSMNALAGTPTQMALKAARLRPDLVYAILLANPTLNATGRALFNVTDGNLGSSSALNAANLKTAITAFMLVRENAVNLNIMPTHLIVPPSLMFTARELINSTQIVIAGTAGAVAERGNINTLAGMGLQIVSDARLENGVINPDDRTTNAGSATSWFLASTQVETIKVGYYGGRVPSVRSFVLDKGKYGIGWDIKLDIGAKAMDWRGLRKVNA